MSKALRQLAQRGVVVITALFMFACSGEPAAVKKAYDLMSHGMCAEAIAPLKAALVDAPNNRTIPQALCKASLCELANKKSGGESLPSIADIQNYCKQGFGDPANASDAVFKAYVASTIGEGDSRANAQGILTDGSKQFAGDAALAWYRAYVFDFGVHWKEPKDKAEIPRVALDEKQLGDIIAHQDSCLSAPAAGRHALVRRGGADILSTPTTEPENRFQPGDSFDIKGVAADRLVFTDANHEHWRRATGWILVRTEFMNFMSQGQWRKELEAPLDARLVSREIPNRVRYGGLGLQRDLYCGGSGPPYVACLASKIDLRPGSLKYLDRTEYRGEAANPFNANTTYRAEYREVQFDERESPDRMVPAKSAYVLAERCIAPAWRDLLLRYGEWSDGVIEAGLRGEIHRGHPALILSAMGWQPREVLFDRTGILTNWHGPNNQEVTIRDGRVQ